MIIQLTLLASVFVCYGDSYIANRRPPPFQETDGYTCGKFCKSGYNDDCSCKVGCEEEQNFAGCDYNITDLFLRPRMARQVFSYNTATGQCEPLLRYCSRTEANEFLKKRKCKQYCGGNKGCYVRGKWYNDGDQTDTMGCCHCQNGIRACQTGICGICQKACTTCANTDSECPEECNCPETLIWYLEQNIH